MSVSCKVVLLSLRFMTSVRATKWNANCSYKRHQRDARAPRFFHEILLTVSETEYNRIYIHS